ncbi:Homeodomain [Penicillium lividum]|nr:Homeodomain [Penicillium lividum]
MSDPELSVPASSSPSLPATECNALNYAFLVHSQKTLTQNLPPRVDNKLLARQKRRRTSPEDHAILETEYQKDPKPDKVARANIVNRVSLGEKEVQIWFQNRRQNDRRKSRPLQPHELLAPRSSMSDSVGHPSSDDNASAEPGSSSGAELADTQDRLEGTRPKSWGGDLLQLSDDLEPVTSEREEPELPSQSTQTSVATVDSLEDTPPTTQEEFHGADLRYILNDTPLDESQTPKRKRSIADIQEVPQEPRTDHVMSTPTKSPPSLRLSMSFDGEAMVRKEDEMTPSPPKGRNALRIAMSSDGKAVIRAENEPSPSKNRVAMFSVRRTKLSGLRRSNSAIFPSTPRAGMAEKDRVFGRSRDPRNWESFFDTDARSALSTPASSQTAPNPNSSPSLFQSRGPRSLTRSASTRQSLLSAHPDLSRTPISQAMGEKRRKLSRTVSSMGRLETDRNRVNSQSKLSRSTPSKPGKLDLELDLGDSDKENWIPGTRTPQVRRRTTSHTTRPALRDANRNRGLGLTTGKRNRPFAAGVQGKAPPELSSEVSAFMSGGTGDSQEDDLDCVQGLLSLSQGAWR